MAKFVAHLDMFGFEKTVEISERCPVYNMALLQSNEPWNKEPQFETIRFERSELLGVVGPNDNPTYHYRYKFAGFGK